MFSRGLPERYLTPWAAQVTRRNGEEMLFQIALNPFGLRKFEKCSDSGKLHRDIEYIT